MIKTVEKFIETFHGWKFPIDLNIICNNLNITCEKTNLPKSIKGYYDEKNKKIITNSILNYHTTRIIIAREIRQSMQPKQKHGSDKYLFATELLMPTREFISIWNERFPTQITECAWHFDVSFYSVLKKAKKLYQSNKLPSKSYQLFSDIFAEILDEDN